MKIAICTPVHGDTRAGYTFSLARMLVETAKRRPDLDLIVLDTSSSNVALARQRLLDQAIESAADWLLWLDSDQTFPPNTLLSLLDRGEPVIGANYGRRDEMMLPTAGMEDGADGDPVWTTKLKVADDLLEPVDYMGLGVCLVSMPAIAEAPRPLFLGEEAGEDVIFFRRLRAAGFTPKVDHRLSWQVGHIGLRTITCAGALQSRQLREMQADMARRREAASARTA